MNKAKFQASPPTRYGDAGPPLQHYQEVKKITLYEIKELIKENKISPEQLFSKEEILADPKVKEKVDQLIKADMEKIKKKEDSMIPSDDKPILTPEEKRQQAIDNELVPDDNGQPGDDEDLIPD